MDQSVGECARIDNEDIVSKANALKWLVADEKLKSTSPFQRLLFKMCVCVCVRQQ